RHPAAREAAWAAHHSDYADISLARACGPAPTALQMVHRVWKANRCFAFRPRGGKRCAAGPRSDRGSSPLDRSNSGQAALAPPDDFLLAGSVPRVRCQTVPMFRSSMAALAAMLLVVACGGSPSTSASGPTAASVAVQQGDLPAGMQKCDLSGDIDSFLNKSKTKDPSTYASFKNYWDAAQKSGATAEFTGFYADSTAHCTSIESNSSDVSAATYKLVVDFVIQFKDEASAKA